MWSYHYSCWLCEIWQINNVKLCEYIWKKVKQYDWDRQTQHQHTPTHTYTAAQYKDIGQREAIAMISACTFFFFFVYISRANCWFNVVQEGCCDLCDRFMCACASYLCASLYSVLMWANFACNAACSRTLAGAVLVVVAIASEQPRPIAVATTWATDGLQAVEPVQDRWMIRNDEAVARKANVVALFGVVVDVLVVDGWWTTMVAVDRHVRCEYVYDCGCCCWFGYGSMGRDLPIYWPGRGRCRAAQRMPRSRLAVEAGRRLVEVERIVEHVHRPNVEPSRVEWYCVPAVVRLSSTRHWDHHQRLCLFNWFQKRERRSEREGGVRTKIKR